MFYCYIKNYSIYWILSQLLLYIQIEISILPSQSAEKPYASNIHLYYGLYSNLFATVL